MTNKIITNLQQQRDLPRLLQQMHAQQLPGGAPGPPTMPIAMPHPGLAGGPPTGHLTALAGNGTSSAAQHQLAMLSKQELMLHQRPEDSKNPL